MTSSWPNAAMLCGGSTSRAMGGVRQQFSTAAEVVLARESIEFLAALGPRFFQQVGYLFVATTEDGLAGLEERREVRRTPSAFQSSVSMHLSSQASPRVTFSVRRAAGSTVSRIHRPSRASCCAARPSSASRSSSVPRRRSIVTCS